MVQGKLRAVASVISLAFVIITSYMQSMESVTVREQILSVDKVLETENEDLLSPEEVVSILPQVVFSGGWDKCWVEGVTPWDLGRPTPIILYLLQSGELPNGRVLVPGCGSGYDVVAMASPERYVTGLDISERVNKKATEMASSLPNGKYCTFLNEDFFTWRPNELFDLIFDYVFFCAFEVDMRSAWAKSINELLKLDGELITLMYPIGDHKGGPPYKATVADYEEVLLPLGFRAVSIVDNELAVGPRKEKEKLGRWKRTSPGQSI